MDVSGTPCGPLAVMGDPFQRGGGGGGGGYGPSGNHMGTVPERVLPLSPHADILSPLFYAAFTLVLILGTFGCVSILLLVAWHKRLRTVFSFYIFNVALADLLLCFSGVLLSPTSALLRGWPFGNTLCYLCRYGEKVALFVHGYTLLVASVHTVVTSAPSGRAGLLANLSIWILGLVLCLPYALFVDMRVLSERGQCVASLPASVKALEPFAAFAVFIASPFLAASACYGLERSSAWRRGRTGKADQLRRESARVFWLMSLMLLLCFCPVSVARGVALLWMPARLNPYMNMVIMATHAVAMSIICFTVVFFFYLNSKQLAHEEARRAPLVTPSDI
ncbi:hypothetical protein HPB47_023627 [Ixodes persulcatus]|uniref:Uncharacterized protein n=1 Tax=Ixodes persulcatus TaxID=34615 RepID=A0AC60Q8V5_IXOPE|nr:hypothetical protein HPB47_023627 [Ixodes persulcatus]